MKWEPGPNASDAPPTAITTQECEERLAASMQESFRRLSQMAPHRPDRLAHMRRCDTSYDVGMADRAPPATMPLRDHPKPWASAPARYRTLPGSARSTYSKTLAVFSPDMMVDAVPVVAMGAPDGVVQRVNSPLEEEVRLGASTVGRGLAAVDARKRKPPTCGFERCFRPFGGPQSDPMPSRSVARGRAYVSRAVPGSAPAPHRSVTFDLPRARPLVSYDADDEAPAATPRSRPRSHSSVS